MNRIRKSEWQQFRDCGLLFYVNILLQVFGWCLVVEMEAGEIINAYPARTEYRGFTEDIQEEECECSPACRTGASFEQ